MLIPLNCAVNKYISAFHHVVCYEHMLKSVSFDFLQMILNPNNISVKVPRFVFAFEQGRSTINFY